MRLLVVGTGAMACLFAARLAASGIDITMLGSWPAGLAALKEHGVRLVELDGSSHQFPVQVMESSSCHANYQRALVLVKSWQTGRAANLLKECLDPSGVALTLQNGLGNYEALAGVLGQDRVAAGVTTEGARLTEPGCVQHTGEGKVTIGSHLQAEKLRKLLADARFQTELTDDLRSLQWGKLVINAAINPLTALLRLQNGELLSRQQARILLGEVAQEAANVATAQRIHLVYSDAIDAVEEVARKTASNYSSMLQDVLRGTPTEIDAINGAIVRAGKANGVPTPLNEILWRLVTSLDQTREGQ